MSRCLQLLLPIAMLACGSKAVDLDQAQIVGSSDPTVVGTVREFVTQIAVDDERLYWVGSPGSGSISSAAALRSCLKNDCAGTLLTYQTSTNQSGQFGVQRGEIYWFESQIGDEAVTLIAFPVAGGAARTVANADPTDPVTYMNGVFDNNSFYSCGSDGIRQLPLSGASASPKLIALLPPQSRCVWSLAERGDYVYWLVAIGALDAPKNTATLQRVRKDGSAAAETLASGLELFGPMGLVLDSTYAYWTRNLLLGSIDRCPLAGCVGAPEVVAASVRSPSALLLGDAKIYFIHETDAYQYALSSCLVGQCASAETVVRGVTAFAAMAADDQYLYVATSSQDQEPTTSGQPNPVAQIRRFLK